ncbi:MAG: hypothetical protein ABIE03_01410 [Patescibacteria group bacterium]
MIGSYARFTATRPLHDLDILFVSGEFDPNNLNPQTILLGLQNTLQKNFKNPTHYETKISIQSHSITISFLNNNEEILAVDVVPAFTSGQKNEFGDDIYWVPEILKTSRRNRQLLYSELTKIKKSEIEWWLKSDPRGYIRTATNLNAKNSDFRKTVKLIKRWKYNCKEQDDNFKLKSFHIEQAVFNIFAHNPQFEIIDSIFKFFCDIPDIISQPQIKDRADYEKYIDEYLDDLTEQDKEKIIEARDFFLINLENISESPNVEDLLTAGFHHRASSTEEYLFDSGIPTFLEKDNTFRIRGKALLRAGSFREKVLDAIGLIEIDRKIEFRITGPEPVVDLFKWKVKNDDNSPQPRGEITDHNTRNDPEYTQYDGSHYVECYAIRNGVCIARAKQAVVLKR